MLRKYQVPMVSVLFYVACFTAFQIKTYHEVGPHYWTTFFSIDGARLLATGLLLPSLAICGLWFAHHRSEQTKEQIDLQVQSRLQQQFFDAIKLLETGKLPGQIASLEAIKQLTLTEKFEYLEEANVLVREFIKLHSQPIDWAEGSFSIARNEISANQLNSYAFVALFHIAHCKYLNWGIENGCDLSNHDGLFDNNFLSNACLAKFVAPSMVNVTKKSIVSKISGLTFIGCNLRDCKFWDTEFTNVTFGLPSPEGHATDLTNSEFLSARFEATCFGHSNISGVDFGNTTGLRAADLSSCYFDYFNPPKNVPPGLILRNPAFKIIRPEEYLGAYGLVTEPDSIEKFCEANPNFKQHQEKQLITVSIEKKEKAKG